MHCPRCGQQQISDEIKFCSRCGLPLGFIADVVAQGGILPELADRNEKKARFFNKKNGAVFSVIWCIFFIFLAIVFDGIFNINRLGELFVAKGIFGGILILLISLVYLPSSKQPAGSRSEIQNRVPEGIQGAVGGNKALPHQQTYPVSDYVPAGNWRAPDTSEFVPGSVTDSTTKLLKEEE